MIVSSTRAAAGIYPDRSGPIAVAALQELGFEVDGPIVVADGSPFEAALSDAIGESVELVITSGGTGLSPTDCAPEITQRLIQREVPGISEAIRMAGRQTTPLAALSRGVAGVAGRTLIVNLPGSASGARDGMEVLRPLLRHAVDQVGGGDHPAPAGLQS